MSRRSCAILLVEDEFLIAMDLQAQIESAGYRVIGPAATVAQALSLLDAEAPCAAVLDMNIHGSTSLPIAERLAEAGTPFMFLSGNDKSRVLDRFSDRAVLTKPINYTQLLAELNAICGV